MAKNIRILVIEDEAMIRRSLRRKFERLGYETGEAETGTDARALLEAQMWDLVLLDINLPDANGLDLLNEIHGHDKDLPVIMMTGNHSVEKVVEAMRRGAYNYVAKPFSLDELTVTVEKALEVTKLRREVRSFRGFAQSEFGFDNIIGDSDAMQRVKDMAQTIAASEGDTVLILGESGTGKNLLAQAIHYNSSRAGTPFMEITCTALPEQLLESELFGHERGAFTDARNMKKGLCELAHRGTLFLDEIGDMTLATQAKLLGFLESRSFRRVGGNRSIEVDVRVIAATNQSVEQLIAEKRFRGDLYYRLNVLEITIPPLRERPEDVEQLIVFFVDYFNGKFNKKVKGVNPKAMRALLDYPWPGNVRELRNAIERGMILSHKNEIGLEDLPLRTHHAAQAADDEVGFQLPTGGVKLEDVERSLVGQALDKTKGNQTKAAKLLGISRDQLRYRMKQYDLF